MKSPKPRPRPERRGRAIAKQRPIKDRYGYQRAWQKGMRNKMTTAILVLHREREELECKRKALDIAINTMERMLALVLP